MNKRLFILKSKSQLKDNFMDESGDYFFNEKECIQWNHVTRSESNFIDILFKEDVGKIIDEDFLKRMQSYDEYSWCVYKEISIENDPEYFI